MGFNGSARSVAVLGLAGAGLAGVPAGFHVTAASLNLFDVAASQCSTQSTVSVRAVPGAVAAGSATSYSGSAAPATGAELGSWVGTAPPTACAGSGGWISVPFNTAGLSVLGSAGAKGVALAVEGPASDKGGWKEFAGLPGVGAGSAPTSPFVVCSGSFPCFLLRFAVSRPVFAGFLFARRLAVRVRAAFGRCLPCRRCVA